MTDSEQWNADMDAWGLSGPQRVHHLHRLHRYHQALMELYWARYERVKRIEAWFALGALVALAVLLINTRPGYVPARLPRIGRSQAAMSQHKRACPSWPSNDSVYS